MGALLLFLLKGVLIFIGVCIAISVVSMIVGSLEISFGAGSRKPKEKKQRKKKD